VNVAGKCRHLSFVTHLEAAELILIGLIGFCENPSMHSAAVWLLRMDRGNVHVPPRSPMLRMLLSQWPSWRRRPVEPKRRRERPQVQSPAEPGRTWSGVSVISTPPPNRIKAPLSTTSSRLAFNKPLEASAPPGFRTMLPLVT